MAPHRQNMLTVCVKNGMEKKEPYKNIERSKRGGRSNGKVA